MKRKILSETTNSFRLLVEPIVSVILEPPEPPSTNARTYIHTIYAAINVNFQTYGTYILLEVHPTAGKYETENREEEI